MVRQKNKIINERKDFMAKLLKKRPLSATQILKKINKYPLEREWNKDKLKAKEQYEQELRNLSKGYLNPLEKEKRIFRLNISDFFDYKIIEDSKFYRISGKEFMKNFCFEWEKGGHKNYFHSYYFATPLTYKWKKRFDITIVEKIINRFGEFINKKKDIERYLEKLIKAFQKVEILPKRKTNKGLQEIAEKFLKLSEEDSWFKKNSWLLIRHIKWALRKNKIDNLKPKSKLVSAMFEYDSVGRDFIRHLSCYKNVNLNDIQISFFQELIDNQTKLYNLLFGQEIKVENVFKNELRKEMKKI